MKIDILTLFPEIFHTIFNWSIIGRAVEKELVRLNCINIRDFSEDKHKRVDDYPFGGGPGMVMKPEPIAKAIESVKESESKVIYLSPKGKVYNQKMANKLAREKHLILLSGHYEGIDNRIVEHYIDEEISIGDYVLTGGEIPSLVLLDSIIRLIPGVLGSEDSFIEDSHYNGLLEHPQYTRPRDFNGYMVPSVLLSGNHKEIEKWRLYESLKITYLNRRDLLKKKDLTDEEKDMLKEIYKELEIK
ncbi:tRNA (guanosine(37)-N1)-methyltransferase TrmD [Anaerosalibacter bizertensis]|uniref:tRNA (guanine-N(1)-)-methyltransferase n=1 Tax=Anaerosalibacter bizertensis TaxID=932217 RepID=A0A9Q4A9X9_9FIRM|nr:tRNA (guanosine(37)-N1)-methyltransferase TrmD [Anaerosalibacter bizertensis]MBV1816572.1 tRNA (guanosine(37)-N1)-methyltransferase TrmD [Bacteroidales bacterium MSK.15.36]MCB5558624.1 tRNA (guanosine(37)-N1)-methyltransferase TrmD [Anaerosalibacter bizertensis]MCG4563959.1 tRNA (guanosine(37)-N1)-methyltransferase TrmD [Anaerosalibacter bizertensis]MCG4581916.1 tRNA (guanosine(37)-N1)-methyltransferase TrmD [Anaerosalibacter bizertensis]MCG4586081.1 tRNA (guanosine(37)-N1)-methyltransferas